MQHHAISGFLGRLGVIWSLSCFQLLVALVLEVQSHISKDSGTLGRPGSLKRA